MTGKKFLNFLKAMGNNKSSGNDGFSKVIILNNIDIKTYIGVFCIHQYQRFLLTLLVIQSTFLESNGVYLDFISKNS